MKHRDVRCKPFSQGKKNCTLSAVKIGFLYWMLCIRHFCSFQNGTTEKPIWTTIWMQIGKYNLLLQFMLCFCWRVPEQCPTLLIHHPVSATVTGLPHLFLPVIPGLQEMMEPRGLFFAKISNMISLQWKSLNTVSCLQCPHHTQPINK